VRTFPVFPSQTHENHFIFLLQKPRFTDARSSLQEEEYRNNSVFHLFRLRAPMEGFRLTEVTIYG
jgi:hypothetical protein